MYFSSLLWLLTAELAVASNPPFRQLHVRANTSTAANTHARSIRRRQAAGEEAAALCAEGQAVTYTVQPADTLGKIAKSLGSGICDIAAANELANLDVIFPNQTLTVPVALAAPDSASCVTPPSNATCVEGGEGADTAVVQAGDAFVTIAADLGISSAALQAANPGVDRFNLQAGQVINVPVCSGAEGEVPAVGADAVAAAAEAAGQLLSNNYSSPTTKRSLRARNRGGSAALFQLTKGGAAN
ncbi:peptidase m23b [Apiospora phragmitis]|uniref:Peptidase m23b n=1 Tax=Apiospora phragmitis TaxID=2905665 RepID=A0ABR1V3W0_9PEZI